MHFAADAVAVAEAVRHKRELRVVEEYGAGVRSSGQALPRRHDMRRLAKRAPVVQLGAATNLSAGKKKTTTSSKKSAVLSDSLSLSLSEGAQDLVITDTNFDDVMRSNKRIIIFFTAEWCKPCRNIRGMLIYATNEQSDAAVVATADSDAARAVASRFGIRVLPTVIGIHDGREISRFQGSQSMPFIIDFVRKI